MGEPESSSSDPQQEEYDARYHERMALIEKARKKHVRSSLRGLLIGLCFGAFVTWGRWHNGEGLHLWLVAAGGAMGFVGEYLVGSGSEL
jgi:hypothetical protein